MYTNDQRIVATLDAGGTNFVFGAMKGCENIIEPIRFPSNADNLEKCLATMVEGFHKVIDSLPEKPVAISFAFPGPADYANGIIGGYLPNFPSFREGVALGPFLENEFGIPVFINNDGDLFAYGEALTGVLPMINKKLEEAGRSKRYNNLLGYTFGTGFGMGIVVNGQLNRGDNSCVETFCLPNKLRQGLILEEGVSVRAIKRSYAENSGIKDHNLEPKDIYEIAIGEKDGDSDAAKKAFCDFGQAAGDAMAIAVQIIDGLIVYGGGVSAAKDLFMPSLLKEIRSDFQTCGGDKVKRVQMKIFNLDDPDELNEFLKGSTRKIKVYGTDKEVEYDEEKAIGIISSKMGASKAISAGAYAFALSKLDEK